MLARQRVKHGLDDITHYTHTMPNKCRKECKVRDPQKSTLVLEALQSLSSRNTNVALRPLRIEDLDVPKSKDMGRRKRYDESMGQRYLNSVITARLF